MTDFSSQGIQKGIASVEVCLFSIGIDCVGDSMLQ